MKVRLLFAALVLSLATLLISQVGCDSGSTDGASFRIEPSDITMYSGDTSVGLAVAGGHEPFVWTNTDTTLGTVSGSGVTVTYTKTSKTGVNRIQVTDNLGWVASATISQVSATDRVDSVTISPTTATLSTDGATIVFNAAGGDRNYSWDVGLHSKGSVVKSGLSQAIYTRTVSGDNTVIVTDGDGRVAIANVTQPAAAPLSISPSSASVSSNGASQVFTASGGTGSYSWSIVAPSHGALAPTPSTGSSIVYTSTAGSAAQDVISVTDGSTTVFATITKQ